MATNGVLGARDLLAGIPQAIYTNNNDQATVLSLNVVNRSNVPAKIRVSIGSSATSQATAEFLEFETEIAPKGVLERTGLIVSPSYYLIVKSDVSSCNAVAYGVEVGAQLYSNTITTNPGTTPTWVTPAGSLGTITTGVAGTTDVVSVVATDPNSSQLKYTVTSGSLPAGTILETTGNLTSIKTSTGYTSGTTGQTTSFDITASNGTNSTVRSFSITKRWNDGSTAALAAPSGYWLAQNIGSNYLGSGTYWIKSTSMPSALQMYVDMSEEGGGYDFYRITGGLSANFYNDLHSGKPLGLDLVYPRSKFHWRALRNYVSNVIGSTDYTYFGAIPIYRTGSGDNGSGNYTGRTMRSVHYATFVNNQPVASTYAPDWRVGDGGRWWLRDTTYTEPNGDYTLGAWLGDLTSRNGLPNGYALQDILFNDGGATYSTGANYIVSTNAKP